MTRLAELVAVSQRVAATASRRGKIEALAAFLHRIGEDEVPVALPFLSGELRQKKLSVGWKAVQAASGAPPSADALSLSDVDSALQSIASAKGKGAQSRRAALLGALFGRASAEERDFLARLIVGELRQGALEGVMAEALAAAAGLPADAVRRAATFAGGLAAVAGPALAEGEAALARFGARLMQPVLPMLAQPAADVGSALDALGSAALEWKIDGARVQAHKSGSEVRVFTRNLNDVTDAVPELTEAVGAAGATSLIVDGEAVALHADGRPRPFQVTMRRFGRKLDVAAARRELPLSAFFFDCLLLEGEPLAARPWRERRRALESALGEALLTPCVVTAERARAEAFYEDALARGHEGIMAKDPGSAYEAGRRGAAWLKVKRAHTLDLVVLAAEWGHGRRRGRLSNLHLGAREAGGYAMLGKTFKGLTDQMLEWQTRELLAREVSRDEWTVRVRPELVVEVAFNDVQESPHYPAGLALRFARVKAYRVDKRPEDADTLEAVRRIYEQSLS